MRIVFTIGYRVSSDFSCSTCPPLRFLLSLFITVSSSFCNSFFFSFLSLFCFVFLALRQHKYQPRESGAVRFSKQKKVSCVQSNFFSFFKSPYSFLLFKEADNLRWAFKNKNKKFPLFGNRSLPSSSASAAMAADGAGESWIRLILSGCNNFMTVCFLRYETDQPQNGEVQNRKTNKKKPILIK